MSFTGSAPVTLARHARANHEREICTMEVRIRPSTPDDEPAIVALMRDAGLNPDAVEGWLRWKTGGSVLIGPRARPSSSRARARSFPLRDRPQRMPMEQPSRERFPQIDWAASRAGRAGVADIEAPRGLADALIGVGGSQ